jgi:tRNA G18 (ribose-2'-O)-methylase SpoU
MIISLSNPLIKQARALRQKKTRFETGLFLVEGIHHVGEVVEAGWDVETILYASGLLTSPFAHDLITRLSTRVRFFALDSTNLDFEPMMGAELQSLVEGSTKISNAVLARARAARPN